MNYKLFDEVTLNGRIENLFDKKYEEVLYYGTLGRTFYIGFNASL
jgi:vitamin B12 transporter